MINRTMLLAANCKYCKIEVRDAFPGETNEPFTELLKYIGKYYCSRMPLFFFEEDHAYIHCAYTKIKKKAGSRLSPHGILEQKLKVSNREIYALRTYYQGNIENQAIARIPYKVAYIFNAIIEILDEMWQDPDAPSIPPELSNCIGRTYAIAFYKKQIEEYDFLYRGGTLNIDEAITRALYDDFHAGNSPFLDEFGR